MSKRLELYMLPADHITVLPDRQRQEVDPAKIARLARSIDSLGLQHPIVVNMQGSSTFLVAGFRRLEAMKLLIAKGNYIRCGDSIMPEGYVPCLRRVDLDPFEAEIVELEENVNREDLTWQEHAKAVARLHTLMKGRDPNWKYKDTLVELGYDEDDATTYHVRDKILLARHLDIPEVASAPTEREAMKVLRRVVHEELLERLSQTEQVESRHTLIQGDAIELMAELPVESIDVILTDPPYGIRASSFDHDTRSKHRYEDGWADTKNLLDKFAPQAYRIAKPDAHCYVFCDLRHANVVARLMENAGWVVWPHPIIWVKDMGTAPSANYGPMHAYEAVLYALKGDKPVASVTTDVIQGIPAIRNKEFAAQKPTELYENLLSRSTIPGDTVLDPFCGSGTIFRAATKMGLTAIGFDNDPVAIALSKEALR